jgi:arachidonate 15-lipoxygenase
LSSIDTYKRLYVTHINNSTYHEAINHLGYTHLLCGLFIAATRRNLTPDHPLAKLLLPHLAGTAFINSAASNFLLADNGTVDRLTAPHIDDTLRLVTQKVLERASADFSFPTEFKKRGTTKADLNIVYPYRDDAEPVWNAIHTFVTQYFALYYKHQQDIEGDHELQVVLDRQIFWRLFLTYTCYVRVPIVSSVSTLADDCNRTLFV